MNNDLIGAVVLAAGQSKRMGKPKLVLPWGESTVIQTVVRTLTHSGLAEIVAVTGGAHVEVSAALARCSARIIYNKNYTTGEMISSVKTGLEALSPEIYAALIVLGDQPQIEADVVMAVIMAYKKSRTRLVVPSYEMKRGHPWLIHRDLWQEVFRLPSNATLRDFLNIHSAEIEYLTVDTPSILADLDTPADYLAHRPGK